ncbi:MAG TPA: O-antigen ligase family protein [Alphaproteobacteria bacterium]|nr:O-antigen ligase family protein [Alphaproteobacteria bacterium]
MTGKLKPSMKKPFQGFFILLAIAAQIQITLFTNENYAGLRVNLADLFLPFMGLFVIVSLFLKQTDWPKFQIKKPYLWLAILSAVLLFSLINGYFIYGTVSKWALINKFIGWFILSGYFLLGAWLVYNSSKDCLFLFIRIFVYFFTAVITINCVMAILEFYDLTYDLYRLYFPIEGLMANKNALTFLFLTVLAMANCFYSVLFSKKFILYLWFLLPIFMLCTGTRAGILALIALGAMFVILRRTNFAWKEAFIGLALSAVIILPTAYFSKDNIFGLYEVTIHPSKPVIEVTKTGEEKAYFKGDSYRLKILETAKNMILTHPVSGSGLGSAAYEQEKQWGQYYAVIDCTPLWLWAESGLIGLGLFLGFYFLCFKALWQNSFNGDMDQNIRFFSQSVLLVLVIFSVMCLFHEILYTRFLWLLMGMGLAFPMISGKIRS